MESQDFQRIVRRPEEYTLPVGWKVTLSESVHTVVKQKTEAQHFDTNRASFIVRSPGLGLSMSTNVMLNFYVDVQCQTGKYGYAEAVQAVFGCKNIGDVVVNGDKIDVAAGVNAPLPKLVFSGGDAFGKCLKMYTLTVNGQSVTNHDMHLYRRTLSDMWISPEAYQSKFSNCGGCPAMYDSVPVSGHAILPHAAYAVGTPMVSGFTGDSGVAKRQQNLLSSIESYLTPDNVAHDDKFRVLVSVPLWGIGLFNPFTQSDKVAETSCFAKSGRTLGHMNNWSLELLFEDLLENIFRNIGTQRTAGTDTFVAGERLGGFNISLATDKKPWLDTTYMRLAGYRLAPATYFTNIFRISTHDESSRGIEGLTENIAADKTREGVGVLANFLPSVGVNRNTRARSAKRDESKFYESRFTAIQSAQPARFLLFCFEKSSKIYDLANRRAGQLQISRFDTYAGNHGNITAATDQEGAGLRNYYYARNQDCNAGIADFSLSVLSSVGAYTYSSEKFPYLKKRRDLWQDTLKNCVADYCQNDMSIWLKHKCGLLIGIEDYIRGLACENSSFPLQIDARVKWYNYRDFISGDCAANSLAIGPAFMKDAIVGKPIMCQIYMGSSLELTSSSCVQHSASISYASSQDILARA
jgi:hypothetical protein